MSKAVLSIGQVARDAGVNIETLRYYERRGLLQAPGRSEGGHRQYPAESVRLVRFVKRAQDLGFALKEQNLRRIARGRGNTLGSPPTMASGMCATTSVAAARSRVPCSEQSGPPR